MHPSSPADEDDFDMPELMSDHESGDDDGDRRDKKSRANNSGSQQSPRPDGTVESRIDEDDFDMPGLKSDDESGDDDGDRRDKKSRANNRGSQQSLRSSGSVRPAQYSSRDPFKIVQQPPAYSIGDLVECKVKQAWVEGFVFNRSKNNYQVRITQLCRCSNICICGQVSTLITSENELRAIQILPEAENIDLLNLPRLSPRLIDKSDKDSLKELQLALKSEFKPAIFKTFTGKDIKDAAVRESWNNYLTYVVAVERVFLMDDLPLDNGMIVGALTRSLKSFCNFISLDQNVLIKSSTFDSKLKLAQLAICGFPCKDVTFKQIASSSNTKQSMVNKENRALTQLESLYPQQPIGIICTLKAIFYYQANNWIAMLKSLESAIKEDYLSRFLIDRVIETTTKKQDISLLMNSILRRYKIAHSRKGSIRPAAAINNKVADDSIPSSSTTTSISSDSLPSKPEAAAAAVGIEAIRAVQVSAVWQQLCDDIAQIPSDVVEFSWLRVKDEFDQILDSSQSMYGHNREMALDDYDDDDVGNTSIDDVDYEVEVNNFSTISNVNTNTSDLLREDDSIIIIPTEIEISQHVKKWFEKERLLEIRDKFQRTLAALAKGHRSYAFSKRLQGCKTVPVFESKLLRGPRILWTYIFRRDKSIQMHHDSSAVILVWYVVMKHDSVPHFLDLIETAIKRTAKQLGSNKWLEISSEALDLSEEIVLIDPMKNVPMRIYVTPTEEIDQLCNADWKAPLRFNKHEQSVRKQQGTVLLLGRSGTGKTLCLIDRMNSDQKLLLQSQNNSEVDLSLCLPQHAQPCSQLFIARSTYLCKLVQKEVECSFGSETILESEKDNNRSIEYLRMKNFLRKIEGMINLYNCETSEDTLKMSSFSDSHKDSNYVDFHKFRDKIFNKITHKSTTLDPLIVWTQIRSFIKGSIEAIKQESTSNHHSTTFLSKEIYLDMMIFPFDRCRLNEVQREEAYHIFLRYQEFIEQNNLWDDMDQVRYILKSGLDKFKDFYFPVFFKKIYVDEVQDYTQAEIELFLFACGYHADNIFLAGDPAQAVVEGVEFRFEEVRSLGYKNNMRLEKAMKLEINYRSHAGVLRCAAAIIQKMIKVFPGSAKTLPVDEGLFSGPKPIYFTSLNGLQSIINILHQSKRMAVICPDEQSKVLKEKLYNPVNILHGNENATATVTSRPVNNIVYGIRQSKGLEFEDVMLIDFFCKIPSKDKDGWKILFHIPRIDEPDYENSLANQGPNYPQLEPYLKMLYTAITRAINRLMIVESEPSEIGNIFFRWLKNRDLAEKLDPKKIGKICHCNIIF